MQVPNDSKMTLEWVQRACQRNPPQRLYDDSGQPTPNFSTGPVRLSWTQWLAKPQRQQRDDGSTSDVWSCTALFPPGVDLTPLVQGANEAGYAGWPERLTSNGFNWAGLDSPWHDQMEKASQYKGYTPGAYFINVKTYFPPRIVDPSMNDILDVEKRVYPGVWAILCVNPYSYKNKRKGVAFGLQSTVIIADDTVLGGGGMDPKKAFKGIQVQNTSNPAAAFGAVRPPMAAPNDPSAELHRLGLVT